MDEEVCVCVRGLLPRQEVVIRAESRDDENRLWCSRAELRADVSGTVDVGQQESTGGSYRGVSQMGLFWSMRLVPEQISGKSTFAKVGTSPNSVRFEVEVEGRVVTSTHLERRFLPPGTATRDLNIHGDTAARIAGEPSGLAWGSVARLFMPPASAGPGPFPAVVVLSGSGGGCDLDKAAVLSRHGFATLALAYFGIPPLPTWLHRVPLDYIEAALIWLAAQPEVDAQRIGALGFSRGSELALLMAAQFPQVRAVVGYAPSSVAWAAGGRDRSTKEVIPAWTWKGKALPCVPLPLRDFMLRSAFPVVALRRPAMFRNLFEAALQDREAVERAAIPVERINGSILLVSGGSDHVWPAAHMSEQIINRLKRHGFAHRVTHLNYPGAGHMLRYPHLPTTPRQSRDPQLRNARFSFGGNAMDDAHAQADSWRGAIDFLKSQL